jgi:hypothetical protein
VCRSIREIFWTGHLVRDPGRSSRVAEPDDGSPLWLPSLSSDHPLQPRTAQPYGVEIRPWLVATIQRSPQRRIESILPTPGTVSPRLTFQMPLGPSKIAIPFVTSRIVHPSIVVGLVSGIGVSFARLSRSLALSRKEAVCCSNAGEWSIVDGLGGAAPTDGFARLLAGEGWCLRPSPYTGRPAGLGNCPPNGKTPGGIGNRGRRIDNLPRQVRRTTGRAKNSFEFTYRWALSTLTYLPRQVQPLTDEMNAE